MKLEAQRTWAHRRVFLFVVSLLVVVGAPVCLYLARQQIAPVLRFRTFGGRFQWDRAGGVKSFDMGSPFGGATGEKLWVYLVSGQVKPILGRKLRQGPWQKASGEVWLRVAGVIPFVLPGHWGPCYQDPNGFFVDDYTPLMLAVDHRDIDSVRKLLAAGADVNAKDVFGRTALSWACSSGRASDRVIELLLSAGADPNAADKVGVAPLYPATIVRSPRLLQRLLQVGAKVNATDKWGRTALMAAAGLGAVDSMQVLLAAGADVNMQDERGETALMAAARETRRDALRVLVAAGADLNIRDRAGETALSFAERRGYLEAADLLRAAGAKR
jgi:ankyrin repeat protein